MKKLIKKAFGYMNKPEMLTLPSSLAYYFVLAIVPITSFLLMIASNLKISTNYLTTFFEKNFSSELASLLTPLVTNQTFSIAFLIYVLVALYIVSNGADQIIVASNTIFNIENKNFFKRRIKALLLTLVLFILFTFLLLVPIFGEQLINLIIKIGFDNIVIEVIKTLYPILNVPLTLLVIYLTIKWIYVLAPDEKIKSNYVTKGAIFTTIGWFIITLGYSFYIKNFATYNLYYAGLSTIVILMIWFYFLGYIFVIGLSMNYQSTEKEIEKTNAIKLKEIEEKVKSNKQIKID